ncbi:MAG: hypothetical protein EB038_06925 [Cyclobacteriaceae bacterium]|nr:hypothetical protein [Cyclobacteriaceae bacterium]
MLATPSSYWAWCYLSMCIEV